MITESELIPTLVTEYFPELLFVRVIGDANRYGFIHIKLDDYGSYHGPAILRLEPGKICIINQDHAWKTGLYNNKDKGFMKFETQIPIAMSFESIIPKIKEAIDKWHAYHNESHASHGTWCVMQCLLMKQS